MNKNPRILLLQPEQDDSQEIYELIKYAATSEFPEAVVETINDLQSIYESQSEKIENYVTDADLVIGNMDGGNVSVTSNLSFALDRKKPVFTILRAGRSTLTPTLLMDLKQINFALKNPEKFVSDLRENIKEIITPEAQARIRQLQSLITQKESEWLDFKREFHSNKAKLLHDILCLSNSAHDGNRYLIFGIANTKVIYGVENDPHKKTNADIHDFLRQIPLSSIPQIELSFHQLDGHEIGVLEIENLPKKPYFMNGEYRDGKNTLRAGAIYTRISDTNVPLNETAPLERVEIMWRERLELADKTQQIFEEFQRIKNKLLFTPFEHIISEQLVKLQDFFQTYPRFLNAPNVNVFYHTFIKSKEVHLLFGAHLNFTQSEVAELKKQLFELDLRSIIFISPSS